jgi:Phosphodiester glycosidase
MKAPVSRTAFYKIALVILGILLVLSGILYVRHIGLLDELRSQIKQVRMKSNRIDDQNERLMQTLSKTTDELEDLRSVDQFKRNEELQARITNIEKTYEKAVKVYENLLGLKESVKSTAPLDKLFAQALTQLSDQNYASAAATLAKLDTDITTEKAKIASTFTIPDNVPAQTAPPGSGYRRQRVDSPVGSYLVDIVSADLGSTRVVVDTASEGDCKDNCPVASLGTFVSRSGAFAGINGPYFCPAAYPGCAGKTNSFDTLLMNKNKKYFNSDNNVYSTVPAVIFSGGSARYVTQSSQWGRDTGANSVIASQPLLMLGGKRIFGGDGEPKRAGKGSRSFIGSTGSTVYIGVVHNASVAEVAHVLETMGIQNALNLDSGGSTALWSGRYIVGPGRDTPFGILFVR